MQPRMKSVLWPNTSLVNIKKCYVGIKKSLQVLMKGLDFYIKNFWQESKKKYNIYVDFTFFSLTQIYYDDSFDASICVSLKRVQSSTLIFNPPYYVGFI